MKTTTQPHLIRAGQRGAAYANASVGCVGVPIAWVYDTAAVLPENDSLAIRWLAGYCRLHQRTADSYAEVLGLDRATVRDMMSNPDADAETRATFTKATLKLRAEWLAKLKAPMQPEGNPFNPAQPFYQAMGKLAPTVVSRRLRHAFQQAKERGSIAEALGAGRTGKTTCAAHPYLLELESVAWVRVPAGDDFATFLMAHEEALGIAVSARNIPLAYRRARVDQVYASRQIKVVVLDQAHWLFPSAEKLAANKPRRLEAVMEWREKYGIGFVLICTEQYTKNLNMARNATASYDIGQWIGRTVPYALPSDLPEHELLAVAKLHGPDFSDMELKSVMLAASSSAGYLGTMVEAIELAKAKLKRNKPKPGESLAAFRLRHVMGAVSAKLRAEVPKEKLVSLAPECDDDEDGEEVAA